MHVREMNTGYVLRRFSLPLYLSVIQDRKVDVILIVPPVAVLLAKSPLVRDYDLSSLRAVFCGAAPLGKDVHALVEKRLSTKRPVHVRQAYGLTEVGLAATYFAMDEWDAEHLTGVGYLVPNVQAKLLNQEGSEVGFGQRGEIYLKGPNVFKGYLNNSAANATSFANGWFKTGDVGVFEESGMLYIVDRLKVCHLRSLL
jgi:4-coumarate--CoA ligase